MKAAKNNSPGVSWLLWREITFYHFQMRTARQSFSDIISETKIIKLSYLMLMKPPVSLAPQVFSYWQNPVSIHVSAPVKVFNDLRLNTDGEEVSVFGIILSQCFIRHSQPQQRPENCVGLYGTFWLVIPLLSIQTLMWSSPKLDARTSSVQRLHAATNSYSNNAGDISFIFTYFSHKETWQLCYRRKKRKFSLVNIFFLCSPQHMKRKNVHSAWHTDTMSLKKKHFEFKKWSISASVILGL